jgi:4'-phosphopantetheinyl transferase
VRFFYGQNGKPTLDNAMDNSRTFAFNMSHSGDLVLIAISTGTTIGIDVEQISSSRVHLESIATSCLNPSEATLLNGGPPDTRARTLLRYWTHKEAYLKAIGRGLSLPIQDVNVEFICSDQSVIRQISRHGKAEMFGKDLACGEDYIGAIAAPGRAIEIIAFTDSSNVQPIYCPARSILEASDPQK